MPRKSLRPNLNQIRTWVRQGRTDAWVAHQLDVSVRDIEQFKRQNELVSDEGSSEGTIAAEYADEIDLRAEDDALIAAELEAAEIEAERARAEAQEQQAAAEEESGAEAPRARTRPRAGSGRRPHPARRRTPTPMALRGRPSSPPADTSRCRRGRARRVPARRSARPDAGEARPRAHR